MTKRASLMSPRLQKFIGEATYEFEFLLPMMVRATEGTEAYFPLRALGSRLDAVNRALLSLCDADAGEEELEEAEALMKFGAHEEESHG